MMKWHRNVIKCMLALLVCVLFYSSDVVFAGEAKKDELVIVLDSGHDATHAGAQNGNLGEEDLVLKIAQYCKAELEKFSNVTVYMTRDGYECANGGKSISSGECNKKRVDYAASVGADVYVSFHLNSSNHTSAHGVGVYYPNNNYRPELGKIGHGLATSIFENLRLVGLSKWSDGVMIRNSESNSLYPDGSLADYLTVIRRSKEAGIPAVLIEHAFLSNQGDVEKFLNTDEKLKTLGKADAKAIIEYYHLSENVEIVNVNTVTGSFDVVISNAYTVGETGKVQVPVWSKSDQSDIVWYTAQKQADGTYKAHVDVAYHNCNFGKYQVHTYVTDQYGSRYRVAADEVDLTPPAVIVNTGVNENYDAIHMDAWHVPGTCGESLEGVSFAVWSEENGQDDIRWYKGKSEADRFVADAVLSNHLSAGNYFIYTYAYYTNGSLKCVDRQSIEVKGAYAENIEICNVNNVTGIFDVVVSNVKAIDGVQQIEVPVWSTPDQSDIVWYIAEEQADGTYRVRVDVANHNCRFVNYQVHIYAKNKTGQMYNIGMEQVDMTTPGMKLNVAWADNYSGLTVDAWHVPGTFGQSLEGVTFAVWSEENGQDDLYWYTGVPSNDRFMIEVPLENHSDVGIYFVHVYADRPSGSEYLGGMIFERPLIKIMGASQITKEQLIKYYEEHASYPAYYANTDAGTLDAFCQMYIEECAIENVKVEVAFCQAMLETGFLSYKGDVDISQHNFAGIGATGNGNPGNSFSTVREGIRAQVQHLKAYASSDDLVQTCVDPRFIYVKREAAPYVEWLGINENPYGTGWAATSNYGFTLRDKYILDLYN